MLLPCVGFCFSYKLDLKGFFFTNQQPNILQFKKGMFSWYVDTLYFNDLAIPVFVMRTLKSAPLRFIYFTFHVA